MAEPTTIKEWAESLVKLVPHAQALLEWADARVVSRGGDGQWSSGPALTEAEWSMALATLAAEANAFRQVGAALNIHPLPLAILALGVNACAGVVARAEDDLVTCERLFGVAVTLRHAITAASIRGYCQSTGGTPSAAPVKLSTGRHRCCLSPRPDHESWCPTRRQDVLQRRRVELDAAEARRAAVANDRDEAAARKRDPNGTKEGAQ